MLKTTELATLAGCFVSPSRFSPRSSVGQAAWQSNRNGKKAPDVSWRLSVSVSLEFFFSIKRCGEA